MMGHTRVTMHHDGTAYVHTGSEGRHWSNEEVLQSLEPSQKCAELRRVFWPAGIEWCPCLACNVAKALLKEKG